jgi:hypothetical protein
LVCQVEEVLNAHESGLVESSQQMGAREVAQPDAADHPFFAGPHERGQLGAEVASGRGLVDDAEIHRGEAIRAKLLQVLLDGAQYLGSAVGTRLGSAVGSRLGSSATRGDLADDREVGRVGAAPHGSAY